METPQTLLDLLPGFAEYFRTDVKNLFWRAMSDGYPPDVAGFSRKLIAQRYRIMETRRVNDVPYNLFLTLAPIEDVAPTRDA